MPWWSTPETTGPKASKKAKESEREGVRSAALSRKPANEHTPMPTVPVSSAANQAHHLSQPLPPAVHQLLRYTT